MVKKLQRKFLFASMLAITILLLSLACAISLLYCYSVYSRENNMLELLCETDGQPDGRRPGMRDEGREPGIREPGPAQDGTGGMDEGPGGGPAASSDSGQNDLQPEDQDAERGGRDDTERSLQHGMSMDEALSARFFAVWFDENDEILMKDTSKIYAVSEEDAEEMAKTILSLGKDNGVYKGFRYMVREKNTLISVYTEKTAEDSAGQSDTSAAGNTGQPEETEELREQAGQSGYTQVESDRILVAMDVSSDKEDVLRILGITALIAALSWLIMLLPVHTLARRAIAPTAMSIERQKQFVTNAGHELKTPLAIIQSNTEALELYTGESKWTRNIRAQVNRLSVLTQNLLTLSRMDEDSLNLEKKTFALDGLVDGVWENFAEPAAGRKLSARMIKEEEGELKVFANRESIAQLLSILFDNAVKYTPRGGEIEVRMRSAEDGVTLIQSNTLSGEDGKNVFPEDANRLFERFYRTDSDRSRKKGGYGIGLSAARAIAGSNGGRIRADVEDGKIYFTVTLKKASES